MNVQINAMIKQTNNFQKIHIYKSKFKNIIMAMIWTNIVKIVFLKKYNAKNVELKFIDIN